MMDAEGALVRLKRVKRAGRELRSLSTGLKNRVLLEAAELLIQESPEILEANRVDVLAWDGIDRKASPAFRDRLSLTPSRLEQMAESLRQVARLEDPVGEIVDEKTLPNGLLVRRVRSPLGVILMIFESRPNVATEAFSLAFKSGNAMILRGGKESMGTTAVLYRILQEALDSQKVNSDVFWGISDTDRKLMEFLLQQKSWIDVVVPRGGDGLIDFVTRNSRIPVIKNDRGLCHVYVHEDADFEMAGSIVVNAKTQRPGVCNSMETVLVHQKLAGEFIPDLYRRLASYPVHWFGCTNTLRILGGVGSGTLKHLSPAEPESWDTEYLDLKMNCKVVQSLDEAIRHIEDHGSGHSEAIVTSDARTAAIFQSEVDAAAAYWNASTRFTDGFELGLGGELGISTQKLHVRGPVGLRELTSTRWIIQGNGQIRAAN